MKTATYSHWSVEALESVLTCPVCDSSDRKVLYENLCDRLFGAAGYWTFQRCELCCSAYLDPRPTAASIEQAYVRYYTHASNEQPTSLLKYLSRSARNGYLNRNWQMALTPSSSLLGQIVAHLPALKAKADHELMRSFQRARGSQRLLDVGCGNGQFLALMKAANWEVKGIDFDKEAVAAARERGLNVELGGLEVLVDESEAYDAITLSHVIEHVYNPAEALMQCFHLLRSGGCLWIETPNLDSGGHTLFGRNWRGLEPPRHLVLFNCQSLRVLLEKAGFIDIRPAAWRPQFKPLAQASRQIGEYEMSVSSRNLPRASPSMIRAHEAHAMRSPESREFITFLATKP